MRAAACRPADKGDSAAGNRRAVDLEGGAAVEPEPAGEGVKSSPSDNVAEVNTQEQGCASISAWKRAAMSNGRRLRAKRLAAGPPSPNDSSPDVG